MTTLQRPGRRWLAQANHGRSEMAARKQDTSPVAWIRQRDRFAIFIGNIRATHLSS
jgi:hypothetical protein